MAWTGARVPVTLVGGYLGSGKTTIINHVLATADRRIVVLVNDVGEINIDAALIADRAEGLVELTNGCVCCSLVDGFAAALDQVRALADRPDHLVVELSGVAEPARVVPWARTTGFRADAVVVAVAADQIRRRAADRYVADTVLAQLASADLLAVTRQDLATRTELAALGRWLTTVSSAPALGAPFGAVSVDVLLEPAAIPTNRGGPTASDSHWSTTVSIRAGLTRQAVTDAFTGLPHGVVRAKGTIRCVEGVMLVQLVGDRLVVAPRDDVEALDAVVVIATPLADRGAVASALATVSRLPDSSEGERNGRAGGAGNEIAGL